MKTRILSLLLVIVMVLGMLPVSVFAADVPFAVSGVEVYSIAESTLANGRTCYTIRVPEGSASATLSFAEDKQLCYYNADGSFLGYISGWDMVTNTTHTVAIADQYGVDPNSGYGAAIPDGVLDGISVQVPDTWRMEYFIQFAYGTPDAPGGSDYPFLSIKIADTEIAEANIQSKGAFFMGDYHKDETSGSLDQWDYVHEVPYYVVTVPCGTTYVDVTYPADPELVNANGKASGYATVISEADATSSATVKGRNSFAAYTKNSDGTQTVTTPVAAYALNKNGEGLAISVERNGGAFEALCLFSFVYDGQNHVYTETVTAPTCTEQGYTTHTCSCGDSYADNYVAAAGHKYVNGVCSCGERFPKNEPKPAEIPEGAPFTAIAADAGAASVIEQKGEIKYSYYSPAPYYHVTIPEGATKVYVTHPSSVNPFCDTSYNSSYGYYASVDGSEGGMTSFAFTEAEGGYCVTLPLTKIGYDGSEYSFLADEDGVVSYAVTVENTSFEPICFFSFAYAAADAGGEGSDEHICNFIGTVTTPATCVTPGVMTYSCTCGQGTYTEVIPKSGHTYNAGEVTTPATCTENGVKTFTCTNGCPADMEGHSYEEVVPAVGHIYNDGEVTTAATCKAEGVKTFTCTVCPDGTTGHSYTEPVKKLEHAWNDGEVTKPATCKEAGEMTFTCQNPDCGETKTEPIAKLEIHTPDADGLFCKDCETAIADAMKPDENGVYQIGTAKKLLWFAKTVNNGSTAIKGALTADITVDANWPGIGTSSKKFAGSFDGNQNVITLENTKAPLFAYINGTAAAPAQVKNVIVEGTVASNGAIANIATNAVMEGCINRADVTSTGDAAGIVANPNGYSYMSAGLNLQILNCGNEGNISGNNYVGGILSVSRGGVTISGCYNTGKITGATKDTGGICGYLQGYKGAITVSDCYNLGSVSGGTAGGLIGNQYNGVTVKNCYNAGEATYAIVGNVYNGGKNSSVSNTYYRADRSTYGAPATANNAYIVVASKTLNEMLSADFAALLGTAFKTNNCCGPVLTWQETYEHDLDGEGICRICGFGQKQTFNVTLNQGTGYTIEGEATVEEGKDYTFTVIIAQGYEPGEDFAIRVGENIVGTEAGAYTVERVAGPLSISVTGVQKIPDSYKVSWSDVGNGFRVHGEATAITDQDYTFTVTMHENFRKGKDFAVKANGNALTPDANGTYTIEKVHAEQTITVSGVEAKPYTDTVSVTLTATKGLDTFFRFESDTIAAMIELDVPYFDLALYDLQKYYYNPYCYVDEAGNIKPRQEAGTRESAYGHITAIHTFIYATETLCLELGEIAGTGKAKEQVKEYISWTQDAGSSFMDLWGFGTNLNYYVNYEYPLAYPEWGSTSDQIVLKDGDIISIHMITGSASGSEFQFFVVNDKDQEYTIGGDQVDSTVVTRGETVDLTLFRSVPTGQYTTSYNTLSGKQVYWIDEDNFDLDVNGSNSEDEEYDGWYKEFNSERLVTGTNGKILIDTTTLEAGTYYFAVIGDVTPGGTTDGTGFVSKGGEAGPALFKLTVNANPLTEAKAEAKEEIAGYKNANDYREVQKTELAAVIETANAAIDAAETVEAVEEAVAAAKAEMDKIKTDAQLTEEEAAAAVDTLINDIGEVTLESEAAIAAARAAYEALTDAQKALVTGLTALEAAEKTYEELVAANAKVQLCVSGTEEVTVATDELTYTIAMKDAVQVATAELTIELSTDVLGTPVIEGKNGWFVILQSWKDGVLTVLMGNNAGLTSEEYVDILSITAPIVGETGTANLVVTEAVVSAYAGEGERFVEADLTEASFSTKVEFNIYDVNRDGVVDQLDITRAQRCYGDEEGAENWNPRADVNGDKTVDINDLILILNNYTK